MESHYCRANSNKIYLEPVFRSFVDLNEQYKIYCNQNQMPTASLSKCRYYFKGKNYSLYQPKKDQCDICTAHNAGNVNDAMYNNHIKAKEDARAEKIFGR